MTVDSYEVVCKFSDDVERRLLVPPGTSILGAALEQGISILHQCRSGSCGSCVGRLISGEATMRSTVAAALLESERKAGLRLTCVCEATSDCTFEFDYPSDAGDVQVAQAAAFVDAIDWVADDVVKLELELAEGDWMAFKPGQFLSLRVPGTDAYRRYSFASTPQALPRIELLIRVLDEGLMSDYLRHDAKIDDVLEIAGPYGSFFWREDLKSPQIFIAGGTGLAPMMSILDVIRQKNGKKPDFLLSFGCRDPQSLFYVEELELREFWMPTLEKRIFIDCGEPPAGVNKGNPVEVIGRDDVCSNTVAYLCGPPPMIDAAHKHLESLGIKLENIHAELFIASE